MKITPGELPANGYVLLDKLGHKELVPFIKTYINKRTKYSIFYYSSNFFLFGIVGYLFFKEFNVPGYDPGNRFTKFSFGLAIAIGLLPIHEYIHVLAYKSQGSTKTSYGANLKKFYFMALADGFVANKKEFEVVALAPFVVITILLSGLLFLIPSAWALTIMGTLICHTAMCSGDFGLLSYFEYNKERQVVTFDDVENKVSYFYGRPLPV